MTNATVAKYKCCECGHEWVWFIGSPENKHHMGCPECGGLYYAWKNYKDPVAEVLPGDLSIERKKHIHTLAEEFRQSGKDIVYPNGGPTIP